MISSLRLFAGLIRRFDNRVWNAFSEKLGWRDLATNFIEELGKEEGLDKRPELKTAFEVIE